MGGGRCDGDHDRCPATTPADPGGPPRACRRLRCSRPPQLGGDRRPHGGDSAWLPGAGCPRRLSVGLRVVQAAMAAGPRCSPLNEASNPVSELMLLQEQVDADLPNLAWGSSRTSAPARRSARRPPRARCREWVEASQHRATTAPGCHAVMSRSTRDPGTGPCRSGRPGRCRRRRAPRTTCAGTRHGA